MSTESARPAVSEVVSRPRLTVVPERVGATALGLTEHDIQNPEALKLEDTLEALLPHLESRREAFASLLEQAEMSAYGWEDSMKVNIRVVNGGNRPGVSRIVERKIGRALDAHVPRLVYALIVDSRLTAQDPSLTMYKDPILGQPFKRITKNPLDEIMAESQKADSFAVAINNAEEQAWNGLETYLDTFDSLLQFSEWIGSEVASGDALFRPLFEMLAIDLHDEMSPKKLQTILQNCCQKHETLVDDMYVDALLQSDADISRWARMFGLSKAEAKERFLAQKDVWETDTKVDRYNYNNILVLDTLRKLGGLVKQYQFKYQQVPTQERSSAAIRKKMHTGSGKHNAATHKKSAAAGRVTPKLQTANAEIELPPENTVGLMKLVDGAWHIDDDNTTIEQIVSEFAKPYDRSADLEADMLDTIESLRTRPFGNGTKPLKDVDLGVGVNRTRSVSPYRRSDLPLKHPLSRGMRIVYTTKSSQEGGITVGILGLFTHPEYDKWARHYSS